jgi:hypothetical protein
MSANRAAYLSTLKYLFSAAVIDAGYPTRLADIRPLYWEAARDAAALCRGRN